MNPAAIPNPIGDPVVQVRPRDVDELERFAPVGVPCKALFEGQWEDVVVLPPFYKNFTGFKWLSTTVDGGCLNGRIWTAKVETGDAGAAGTSVVVKTFSNPYGTACNIESGDDDDRMVSDLAWATETSKSCFFGRGAYLFLAVLKFPFGSASVMVSP